MTQQLSPPRRTNGLGIAGFVVSLIAIFTGGILSPIALLICFVALFKSPRGFAFAGFLIALLGTAILAAWLSFFGILGYGCFNLSRPTIATAMAIDNAHKKIDVYRATHANTIPDIITGNELIAPDRDGWGRPLHYIPKSFGHEIRSDGSDGVPGTEDDLNRNFD
jgi:hypothetical protein